MNVKEGDRVAAIAILEPSANGNGDDDPDHVAAGEPLDAEALASVIPTSEAVEEELASEEDDQLAESEDEDEELIVDTGDDAKDPDED
jgi:hypothetical protein